MFLAICEKDGQFRIHTPHIGISPKRVDFMSFYNRSIKINAKDEDEAKTLWEHQANYTKDKCMHMFWKNSCKTEASGDKCNVSCNFSNLHFRDNAS